MHRKGQGGEIFIWILWFTFAATVFFIYTAYLGGYVEQSTQVASLDGLINQERIFQKLTYVSPVVGTQIGILRTVPLLSLYVADKPFSYLVSLDTIDHYHRGELFNETQPLALTARFVHFNETRTMRQYERDVPVTIEQVYDPTYRSVKNE